MELKEFIKQTIIQITNGLVKAYKYDNESNFGEDIRSSCGKEINFDIAVTSNEEEKTEIGGKIATASIFTMEL